MAGLRDLCRLYGRMQVGPILWLWDYATEEPVKADEMPPGSGRWQTSERAKWRQIAAAKQAAGLETEEKRI